MAKPRRGRGEGSFEQTSSGAWRWIGSVNGKKIQSPSFPTKKEAQEWRDQNRGKPVAVGTVGEWLTTWLALHKPEVAASTFRHDDYHVQKTILPRIGTVKLKEFTSLSARELLNELTTEKRSASERQKVGAVMRKAFAAAVLHGVITANPLAGVRLPSPRRPEKRTLTPDEIRLLFAAASDREAVWLRVSLDGGLRPGELLGLRWDDFNLAVGTFKVQRSVCSITGALIDPKTRRSRRTVPLSASTLAALRANPGEGVFVPDSRGGHWWTTNFSKQVFRPLAKRAGVPWATGYTLRHTAATLLIQAGVPVKVVSERLGHEDIATTLRTYTHVLQGDQEKAAGVWESLINPENVPKRPKPE